MAIKCVIGNIYSSIKGLNLYSGITIDNKIIEYIQSLLETECIGIDIYSDLAFLQTVMPDRYFRRCDNFYTCLAVEYPAKLEFTSASDFDTGIIALGGITSASLNNLAVIVIMLTGKKDRLVCFALGDDPAGAADR